ncbi:MAG: hypothetical protein JWQ74_30 [Marmoricola sp.]|nr:hypothetical protein [Marmoricola sp.]
MFVVRGDLQRARRWLLPPALAWVAASLVTWAAASASGFSYWSTTDRRRWDSEHYLSIAKTGYEMFNCRDRYANFPDVVCGNVAWFPGYSMIIRGVARTGLSYELSAVLISEVALFAMFAALWWLLGGRLSPATGLTMAIGTVFPGGVYYHAMFPIAVGTLGLMVAVVGVRRGSWALAAVGGFVASSAHLVGAVGCGMLVLSVLFAWKGDPWPVRAAKAFGSAAIAYGGVLFARWMMWRATGHWNAYEIINRSSYGQGDLKNPFTEFRDAYDFPFARLHRPDGVLPWLVEHSLAAHHTQLYLNTAFVAVVVAATAYRLYRDRRLEPEEWAALLLTGAIFVVPFFAGALMSWYRNHAQMFVALVLVKNLPRWLQVVLLVLCAVQYVLLASMFFANVIV